MRHLSESCTSYATDAFQIGFLSFKTIVCPKNFVHCQDLEGDDSEYLNLGGCGGPLLQLKQWKGTDTKHLAVLKCAPLKFVLKREEAVTGSGSRDGSESQLRCVDPLLNAFLIAMVNKAAVSLDTSSH